MRKLIVNSSKGLVVVSMLLGLSGIAFAISKDIAYKGEAVAEVVHLAKGEKITINTTVPVGTKVIIEVTPKCKCTSEGFLFESSMENVAKGRKGGFADRMFTGANPGWVSYTFTGEYASTAIFKIHP